MGRRKIKAADKSRKGELPKVNTTQESIALYEVDAVKTKSSIWLA